METEPQAKSGTFRRSLRTVLIGIGVLALLWGLILLLPMLHSVQDEVVRRRCVGNLKQIGLALHNYHAAQGAFPAAYSVDAQGRPAHSWRTWLTSHLGSPDWFQSYDWTEPWDGPNNRKLHDRSMHWYSCPADPAHSPTTTSYLAIVGPETAWPGRTPSRIVDIRQGTTNTLMLVEVARSGIHWMEPKDLDQTRFDGSIDGPSMGGISSGHANGTYILMADGSCRFLSDKASPQVVHVLATNHWTCGDEFHQAVAGADRIVVRDGGFDCCDPVDGDKVLFEVTEPQEIREVQEHLRFERRQLGRRCNCCGYPGVDWYRGGERIALTAVQHGHSLRWKRFPADARLTKESMEWLGKWFARHALDRKADEGAGQGGSPRPTGSAP